MASECRDGSQGSADLPGGDAGSLARFGRAVRPPGGLRRLLVHVVETAAVRVQEGKRRRQPRCPAPPGEIRPDPGAPRLPRHEAGGVGCRGAPRHLSGAPALQEPQTAGRSPGLVRSLLLCPPRRARTRYFGSPAGGGQGARPAEWRRIAGGISRLPEAEAYSGCFRLDRPRFCVPEVGIRGSGTPFPDASHHAVLDQERRSVKDILGVLVRAGMPPKKVAFVGFFKGGAMVSQARASTTTVAALLLVTASCAAQRPPVE